MKFLRGIFFAFFFCSKAFCAVETISSGSFIVNMGVIPQTIANGLKPYGLVYELLNTYHVPVKWIINPSKAKDGGDFTYNGTVFSGGAFVILSEYRTAAVNAAINSWIVQGVVGQNTNTPINLEVYATLTYAPRWTIDRFSGNLVTPFFLNAGIPDSAHGGSLTTGWKLPSELTQCDDIFALPHADPTWNTHNNLLAWNRDYRGAIWSGCHAPSVMEDAVSPDNSQRMNFLSTNGFVNYQAHQDGTPPYSYAYDTNPIMQFIGSLDLATNNGSEGIYLLKPGSSWRPGVEVSVWDPTHSNVPAFSPGPATVLAYGRGFADTSRGWVMYQGGHFHNGGTGGGFSGVPFNSHHIALQRAFFNFAFMAVVDKQNNSIQPQISAASTMLPGVSYPVSFTLPAGTDLSQYTFEWSASSGTIIPDNASQNITYIPDNDLSIRIALITLVMTDACGRQYFETHNINMQLDPNNDGKISVPQLLSPNKDGSGNDYLHIKNIELYPDNEITIYNRWGNIVYKEKGYDNSTRFFAGSLKMKSTAVTDGVFYYVLTVNNTFTNTNTNSGSKELIKGYFILRR